MGAWGFQAEAYQNGAVIASGRVKNNGHFEIQVPENEAYSIRFLLRYCPDDICFSFQTDKGVLYQLWHPQASLEEMRTTAAALRTHMEFGESVPNQRLWVFTSQENYALAEADGTVSMLEEAGALVLVDTCYLLVIINCY